MKTKKSMSFLHYYRAAFNSFDGLRVFLVAAVVLPIAAQALEPLSESEMSNASGAGIAFIAENFSIKFDDASNTFIHLKPVGPTTFDTALSAYKNNPLDIYLYGLQLGAATAVGSSGVADRNVGTISNWGTGADPFVLQVLTPGGVAGTLDYAGNPKSTAVVRLEAPTNLDGSLVSNNLKLALWGDFLGRNRTVLEETLLPSIGLASQFKSKACSGVTDTTSNCLAGSTTPYTERMRLQTIWSGFGINGTQLNLFQTGTFTGVSQHSQTLGFTGILRLNSQSTSVLRLTTGVTSAETNGTIANTVNFVPTFDATEGIYLTNVDINIPLGRLSYQPLTISKVSGSNNLAIELARIPDVATVYDNFYQQKAGFIPTGGNVCTRTSCGDIGNPASHGSINIDKIEFKNSAGTTVDTGSVKIDGLLINHFKFTTTGL